MTDELGLDANEQMAVRLLRPIVDTLGLEAVHYALRKVWCDGYCGNCGAPKGDRPHVAMGMGWCSV